MDGAMKFVKGDAVAAMIIAVVNILAGVAIGSLTHGMSVSDAIDRYTILTVGDGMVSQIPSLLVSIAAGIIITRVSTDDENANLGGQIGKQVLAHPMALLITGGMLLGFVMVPGFPKFQFATLGVAVGGAGYLLRKQKRELASYERTPMPAMRRDGAGATPPLIGDMESAIAIPLLVRISPSLRGQLVPAVLDAELTRMRGRLQLDLGVPFPGVRMTYDAELGEDCYAILVQEIPVANGSLRMPHADTGRALPAPAGLHSAARLALSPAEAVAREKVVIDDGRQHQTAERMLTLQIERVLREQAASFLGMQEVQQLVDAAQPQLPELAAEVLRVVSLQRLTDVLRRLVEEGVSIRHLREIFESLVTWAPREKDPVLLTEYVRIDLGRFITHKFGRGRDSLNVIMFDPKVEKLIRESIQQTMTGNFLALAPEQSQSLVEKVRTIAGTAREDSPPVLLVSMDVRRYAKKLVEPQLPALAALSYQEVSGHIVIQPVGRVEP
jgi:type III secretion protein V